MKVCLTTVVSDDLFQYYIPLFVYTAKKAYPNYGVKIFLRGRLNKHVRKLLNDMKKLRMCNPHFQVYEDYFLKYPKRISICNTLRHLLPADKFEKYDYLYITDIDFLIFRHEPTLGRYFQKRIEKTKLPYASFRGPYTRPRRPQITPAGWKGKYSRIADGTLMLKIPQWFNKTRGARNVYNRIVKKGRNDEFDFHPAASYREYNEVMLYRICVMSGIKTPKKKNRFVNGERYDRNYRDIHLGDFKFRRGSNPKRMDSLITKENIKHFKDLEKDETWLKISKVCEQNKTIKSMLGKLRHYVRKR